MLHLENSRWSKVEQVEQKAPLKSAPPPPPPVRGWCGGAVEQGRETQVEQIMTGAHANTFTPFGRIAARIVARFGGLEA